MQDTESTPRAPWARAVVRGGRVTLNAWTPSVVTGGPQRAVLAPLAERGVALADLTSDVFEDGSEELVVEWVPCGAGTRDAADALVAWARTTGYRRVWLPDRVVDIDPREFSGGRAVVSCPTCTLRWEDESPDFWAQVRGCGLFPGVCPACNGSLPEWEVLPPAARRPAAGRSATSTG